MFSGTRIMYLKKTPATGFSWRDSETAGGRVLRPSEGRVDSTVFTLDGLRASEGALDPPEGILSTRRHRYAQFRQSANGEGCTVRRIKRINFPKLGGTISGHKQLLHGNNTGTMRFSFR